MIRCPNCGAPGKVTTTTERGGTAVYQCGEHVFICNDEIDAAGDCANLPEAIMEHECNAALRASILKLIKSSPASEWFKDLLAHHVEQVQTRRESILS